MDTPQVFDAEGTLLWNEARALLAAYSEDPSPDRRADLLRRHAEWQVRFAAWSDALARELDGRVVVFA
jgi:hypothetical protein